MSEPLDDSWADTGPGGRLPPSRHRRSEGSSRPREGRYERGGVEDQLFRDEEAVKLEQLVRHRGQCHGHDADTQQNTRRPIRHREKYDGARAEIA